MKSCVSGLSPLCIIRAVGQSFQGSEPEASISSLPMAPIGVHILSQTVNRKLVSTLDLASVSLRAVAAIRFGLPD